MMNLNNFSAYTQTSVDEPTKLTIVELEPSEMGGTKSQSSCDKLLEKTPDHVTSLENLPTDYLSFYRQHAYPKGDIPYGRTMKNNSNLTNETTTKTTSTRSKPWKEVNDEIAAKMMAMSSDSPPMIPRRNLEESPRKNLVRQNQRPIGGSYNTSECSSTDDCRNLIDQQSNKVGVSAEERQIALCRQVPPPHQFSASPYFCPPLTNQMQPFDAPFPPMQQFYSSPMLMYSPNMPPMPPPPLTSDARPFPIGYSDPAASPFSNPPFFAPPFFPPPPTIPPLPLDYEMFGYETRRKKKKMSSKNRRSQSIELGAFPPPPFFGAGPPMLAPPHPFFPPMPPAFPPPLSFGRPSMLAIESGQIDQSQLPPFHHGLRPIMGEPFEKSPYSNNAETSKNGGLKRKNDLADGNGVALPVEFYSPEPKGRGDKNDVDWTACCKGFSQVLWIILTIILVGLILGLVLGLTLV